jgi:hypothetical protein
LSDPGLHKTHQGTFQVLVGHLPAPVEGNNSNNQCQQFYLQTADKGIMTLDLPRQLAERLDESELSGSEVEVQFTEDAINGTGSGHQHRKVLHMRRKPAVLHHRLVKSLLVTWPGSTQLGRRTLQQVVSAEGTAPHGPVRMIVFIMDLTKCGTAKPVTTPQVRLFSMIFRYLVCKHLYLVQTLKLISQVLFFASPQRMMDYLNNTQPQSLSGFYDTCTMQKVKLNTSGSVSFNIPFPCSGKLADGTLFNTSTCDNNLFSWSFYAEQHVNNTFGVNVDAYAHRSDYTQLSYEHTYDCG